MHYFHLTIAVLSEVIATTALKSAEGFTRPVPSAIVVAGYGSSFYFLSLCLQRFNVGVAYAIWCGIGMVFITLLGFLIHKQRIDAPALLGMALIIAGVAVMNLCSKTVVH